jgi:hypothetical protein
MGPDEAFRRREYGEVLAPTCGTQTETCANGIFTKPTPRAKLGEHRVLFWIALGWR